MDGLFASQSDPSIEAVHHLSLKRLPLYNIIAK